MKLQYPKLRGSLIWASLAGLLLNISVVNGANVDTVNPDGSISVLRCGIEGVSGFGTFLDAVLWNDKLDQGFTEPIIDIFGRNQCHTNDISGLINQQDKLRSQIRRAYLTCNFEDVEVLKVAYHKLSAEIYYVRNLVNGQLAISLPFQVLNSGNSNRVFKDRDALYSEMLARYGQETFFGVELLNALFLGLEVKYNARKENYINCETGNWSKVAERWSEFQNNFSDQYGDLQTAYGRNVGRSQRLGNQIGQSKTLELFNGDSTSFGAYVGSFVSAQVNGIEPEKGILEIVNDFAKQLPEFREVPLSNQQLISNIAFEGKRFEIDKMEAEMKGFFDVRYGTSTESTEILINHLDGRNSNEVTGLLQILDKGVLEINRLDSGLNDVNLRQCVATN